MPPAAPDYTAGYTATINTNLGKISINLLNSKATCTVNSFIHLASASFWNDSQCHRLSTSGGLYILQCGDPYAKASAKLTCPANVTAGMPGTGGPGYEFASENLTGATYKAGTVAMANNGSCHDQREPVLPRVQGHHTVAAIHPVRDNYLRPGYPPESSESRHFMYLSRSRWRYAQGESRHRQRDYPQNLSNTSP